MLLASGHTLRDITRMSFAEIAFAAGCIWMSRAHLINVLLSPLIEGSGDEGESVAYKPATVKQPRRRPRRGQRPQIKRLPSRSKGVRRYRITGVPQPAPTPAGATNAQKAARENLRWAMISRATGVPIRSNAPPAPPVAPPDPKG